MNKIADEDMYIESAPILNNMLLDINVTHAINIAKSIEDILLSD